MSDCFDHMADAYNDDDRDPESSHYRKRTRVYPKPTRVKCKICGATDLKWVGSPGYWRLVGYDNKTPHTCESTPFNALRAFTATQRARNVVQVPTAGRLSGWEDFDG